MRQYIKYISLLAVSLLLSARLSAQTTSYVLNSTESVTMTTGITSFGGVQSKAFPLSGPGSIVSFQIKKNSTLGNNNSFWVEYSTDGSTWNDLQQVPANQITTSNKTVTLTTALPAAATHIRFNARTGCTMARTVSNVKVTRATLLESNTTSLDFGMVVSGSTKVLTVPVAYNNTVYPQQITGSCDNSAFSVAGVSAGETGSLNISVTYAPSDLGSHSGTVTLSMNGATYKFAVQGECIATYKFNAIAFASDNASGVAMVSQGTLSAENGDPLELTVLSSDASVSREFTFIATPAFMRRFSGWYSDASFSSKVSDNPSYEVTLTATKSSTTVDYALYALFVEADKTETVINFNMDDELAVGDVVASFFTTNNTDSEAVVSVDNTSVITYDASTTSLLAMGEGTATVTVAQAESQHFFSGSKSFTVNVVKRTPDFTWTVPDECLVNSVFYNAIAIEDADESLMTVTIADGTIATYEDGVLRVGNVVGSTGIQVKHAGNSKWQERIENYTLNAVSSPTHVEFTLTKDNYSIFIAGGSGSYDWNSDNYSHTGLRVGDGGGGFNWDDKFRIIKFDGIPDKLYFNAGSTSGSATGVDWYIQESANGSTWSAKIWSSTEKNNTDQVVQLDPSTRYLKLCFSGNFGGVFSDVTVTERRHFYASSETLEFDPVKVGSTVVDKSFTLEHCNAAGRIMVSIDDQTNFSVSPVVINNAGGDRIGSETVTVTYNNVSAGNHTAKVTLTDGVNTVVVNVSAGSYSSDLVLDPANPLCPADEFSTVTLMRTLPAGYSTISLPFDTTIEELSGNASDKVYVLSNVGWTMSGGYTFYFSESEGGVISAGQPYVIYLESEVVNPVWADKTTVQTTSQTKVKGGWKFISNFTPALSMSDLYGVVNSRAKVMRGGANSTLNAFTSYFQLDPQAVTGGEETKASYPGAALSLPGGWE